MVDACGNAALDQIQTITVEDNTAPIVSCPSDKEIFIGANCEVILPDYTAELNIVENCGIASVEQIPAAGTIFTGSDAGVYTIEMQVADNSSNVSSCTFELTVTDEEAFTIDEVNFTDVMCNSSNNGTINVSTTGGTSGLLYSIDGQTYDNTIGVFSNLSTGIYQVSVKNSNGCMSNWPTEIEISEPTTLVIDEVIWENVNGCNGSNNGTITISASGGSPNQF